MMLGSLGEVARLQKENVELQRELQRAHELIGIAPAFFGFVSPTGEVLALNDLSVQAIGTTQAQILGKIFWDSPWWSSLPESASRVRGAIESAAQGEASQFDLEYWSAVGETGVA